MSRYMIEYIKLDKLRTLFNIDEEVWFLYDLLRQSMKYQDTECYNYLYLCPNEEETSRCYRYKKKDLQRICNISKNKSQVLSANIFQNHKLIVFYNSFKKVATL